MPAPTGLARAGGRILLGGARVDAQQHLAGLDHIAHRGIELDDGAGNLRRDHRLANRFDDAVETERCRRGGRLRRHRSEAVGVRLGAGAQSEAGRERGRGEQAKEGHFQHSPGWIFRTD